MQNQNSFQAPPWTRDPEVLKAIFSDLSYINAHKERFDASTVSSLEMIASSAIAANFKCDRRFGSGKLPCNQQMHAEQTLLQLQNAKIPPSHELIANSFGSQNAWMNGTLPTPKIVKNDLTAFVRSVPLASIYSSEQMFQNGFPKKLQSQDLLKGTQKLLKTAILDRIERTTMRFNAKYGENISTATKSIQRSIPRDVDRLAFGSYIRSATKEIRDIFIQRDKEKQMQAKLIFSLSTHFQKQEQLRSAQQEKKEKNRLKALKENDMEKYIEYVQESKNSRLMHILSETEKFLDQVCVRVMEHKDETRKEAKKERKEVEFIPFEGLSQEEMEEREKKLMGFEDVPIEAEEQQPELSSSNLSSTARHLLESRDFYYTIAHTVNESVLTQPKILRGGVLKEYQMKGLQWLVSLYNNNLNGILADEMGLGKTIQTISLLCYLIESKGNRGPFLIIAPLSTISNWEREFEQWAPCIRVITYKGPKEIRQYAWQSALKGTRFDVCLTTYEYVMSDRTRLMRIKWNYIVVDEGHRMKNSRCKFVQSLGSFKSKHRLILTGTPLQNNLPELWSLLNFLLPTIFNSVESFEQWFSAPFDSAPGEKMDVTEEERLLVVNRLHQVLRPFLLRRLKREVEKELPPKLERVVKCDLSLIQRRLYERTQREGAVEISATSGHVAKRGLSNTIMQLRKVCNHPYLFLTGAPVDDSIWRSSGKFELLDRILPKFKASNHRCLIFSQMTHVMDILQSFFSMRGFSHIRLDGHSKDRELLLNQFNSDPSIFIFLLSTRAGGQGLNLQAADTVILFDSDWNPFMDLQAQDRAHRIGQQAEVVVLKLLSIAPIEARIYERAQYKLDVDRQVIQAGKFNTTDTAEERKKAMLEILYEKTAMRKEKSEEAQKASNDSEKKQTEHSNDENDDDEEDEEERMQRFNIPSDAEINKMIARSDEELELFAKMDEERYAEWEKKCLEEKMQNKTETDSVAGQSPSMKASSISSSTSTTTSITPSTSTASLSSAAVSDASKGSSLQTTSTSPSSSSSSGNSSKLPSRLYVKTSQVPDWLQPLLQLPAEQPQEYIRDGIALSSSYGNPFEQDENTFLGHELRRRKAVRYADVMSDREFLKMCEANENEEYIESKPKKEKPKRAKRSSLSPSPSPSLSPSPSQTESPVPTKGAKAKSSSKQSAKQRSSSDRSLSPSQSQTPTPRSTIIKLKIKRPQKSVPKEEREEEEEEFVDPDLALMDESDLNEESEYAEPVSDSGSDYEEPSKKKTAAKKKKKRDESDDDFSDDDDDDEDDEEEDDEEYKATRDDKLFKRFQKTLIAGKKRMKTESKRLASPRSKVNTPKKTSINPEKPVLQQQLQNEKVQLPTAPSPTQQSKQMKQSKQECELKVLPSSPLFSSLKKIKDVTGTSPHPTTKPLRVRIAVKRIDKDNIKQKEKEIST
ncbi:putative chromatin structure-remodeling complex subunit snf2 [Monocercomonoides exilis]|uniref:putative chromatin structure-remodeling complex subunit snf2 n=1 Tax=Monocercomonoides exilis TaxID=2049356 RepID=UPI00355A507F|nr:putative chromatin structure-remodeling complex subunit snf2 [Monocercomonoides exilis]|eukprot:MONOS_3507.1-p1 / transcript=MONOS_3507.1 / gene=MONOS_3507 / organism=Monocercomonoides_exilis_PA203 / gene_product=chromatin structure-remodeling complex subunit snf2 / transcript_product=chromatin structure-remodeling complex subunit snf2 / location=Mono_scaffold00083:38485-42774(+) / protein_length=1429 / sequence_SO=supercontig / SO=protein_coding / is_pseudo=false